ncbi:endonuclease/exonuclease/phosphatase family protein [Allobaculum sp. JKK-2023]|uniref:endonuclease/exonuclease/phosphatase family protein n=1 Tax=Allobaculum sp. JKK-2023 TaxID=3108943 RepID=UPI002B054D83|nr:endonuclease/exonuclease/phosphatase family protein [Allobaculum sp. JKK-2023]
MMKILTLNTHSLQEKEMDLKQQILAEFIAKEQPDVVALQEVNQTMSADALPALPPRYVAVQDGVPMKADNYANALQNKLIALNQDYYFAWLPMKVGYDKYDEGLAIFSRKPILNVRHFQVSKDYEYTNYRIRMALGIETEDGWFFSTHMSWWNDPEEPFAKEWKKLKEKVSDLPQVFLMGDFNGDANVRNETYDEIRNSGWFDAYELALRKDEGWTVSGTIDGWHDQKEVEHRRIDLIWSKQAVCVHSSEVVFNGVNQPILSDHFGVMAQYESK